MKNHDLLLTGFTPFDGRKINGSWVAAQSFHAAHHLQIPVIWGAPIPVLSEKIAACQPTTIISMGEGKQGRFDIESRARNQRKHRIDNEGNYPSTPIALNGPDSIRASLDTTRLQRKLSNQDIPIHVSVDAGQFLCEETLYSLELIKSEQPQVQQVVFVHLPPFGTSLRYQGVETEVDENLLRKFTQSLVNAVLALQDSSHLSENHG